MAFVDDLIAARDNLARELRLETEARLADQLAGKGVKTTYTANGRAVDWNSYVREMLAAIQQTELQIAAQEPYELQSIGTT